jgi:hypothetical protein
MIISSSIAAVSSLVAGVADEEGQRLFEQSKPLFSHVLARGPGRKPKQSHAPLQQDGQPVNERTIQDPDPKTGLAPESRPS